MELKRASEGRIVLVALFSSRSPAFPWGPTMVAQSGEKTLSSAARDYVRGVSKGDHATASIRVCLEAAAALYSSSHFETAEIIYKRVLEKRPSSYRALVHLGYLARRRGDHAAALGYFQTALSAKPHKSRLKIEAATELRKTSRLDEAEALYSSALADRPQYVRALAGLGRIAQARGQLRLAIAHYRAAVAANPGRTDLKLKMAAQLRKLSRLKEAREIYDSILAKEPDHAVARAHRRKLPKRKGSGLSPMQRSWLERDTFTRADEWGRNLDALGIPAFGVSLLTLAQDFACGASEEVKGDCILIRRDEKTKILPLVCDWGQFGGILEREAAALAPGCLLGYVPELRAAGSTSSFEIVQSYREYVYPRESAAGLLGSSVSKYRQEVRKLLKAGAHAEPIGPANLDRVLACNDRWFAGKKKRGRKTYYRRRTLWTFENSSVLELLGVRQLAVMLDDDVIGYSVSSHIGASWAVFVYRRCDREPPGIAPYLVSEMARLYPDREWINDGPAVHKPGLAWFKDRFTNNASGRQLTLGWIKV